MKIKTKLHLIIICNILLLVGIVSVSLLSHKQAEKQLKQQALVRELDQAIFERARLREEYFLYREERSKEQFLLIQKQIGGLLERMWGTFTGPEGRVCLNNTIGFHNKIEGFFNQLVRLDESATVHIATSQALRERIISQMLVNAYSMYREGSRLVNAANEKTVYQNKLAHIYSNIFFGLMALFIVSVAVIIIRSVTYPLTRLHKGTEIVAEGKLDYKTNIRTPDEIGQLSNAFDVMVENLQKITVSRDELSKEIEERKRAEEALLESEKKFKDLIETTSDWVWEIGREGTYTYVSPVVKNLLGYEVSEVLGKTPFDFMPEEKVVEIGRIFQEKLNKKEPLYGIENINRHKDGHCVVLETNGIPIFDDKGQFQGYRGIDRDVTERKRAAEENAILAQIERIISSTLNIEEVYELFAKEVHQLIPFDRIVISIIDLEKMTGISTYIAGGEVSDRRFGVPYPLEGTIAEMIRTKTSVLIQGEDIKELKDHFPMLVSTFQAGFRSIMTVPLFAKGEIIGGLLLRSVQSNAYKVKHLKLAERVGRGIAGAIVNAQLFTEMKKTEKSLRESEERFRLAINATKDGLWEWDIQTNQEFFSPRWCEIIGYSFDDPELPRKYNSWASRIHPDDYDRVISAMSNHLEKGTKYDVDYRHRHKSGEYHWQNSIGQAVFDESGKATKMVGCISDISERKKGEEDLRESNDIFSQFMNHSPIYVFFKDENIKAMRLSKNFTEMLGRPLSELLGKNMDDLFPSDLSKSMVADDMRVLKEDKPIQIEEEMNGRVYSTIKFPVHRQGKPTYLAGFTVDITERKRSEAELLETNRQLEQAIERSNQMAIEAEAANIAKSQFLANMSHEIRTPMNGVIGMTGLLLDTGLSEEQRRYAEVVRSSGEALLHVINDILDFSKIEADKLELEALDFDLRAMLEDTAEMLALRAHEKGLEFVCRIDPEVHTFLRGDPGRLHQILVNLGGNATKFTSEGEVTIHVTLESETGDQLKARFEVCDTGIGIPKDKIGSLFHAFQQVDASTTRQFGGTGLGLAISKRLIEKMGGEVGVESVEGVGSTFWFTAVLGKQPPREDKGPAPSAEIRGVRILAVDDNTTNRLVLAEQLASWGVRHEEAESGAKALTMLREARAAGDPFRIVLTDMRMPGMDGESLGKAIKDDPNLRDTLMVMMTSLGERGDAKRLQDLGFAAYLTKPVKQSKLYDCLATVLGGALAPVGALDEDRLGKTSATALVTRHTISEARRRKIRILLVEDNITNQLVAVSILKKLGYRADAVADGQEAIQALETVPYDIVFMDVQMPVMDGFEATRQIRNPPSGPEALKGRRQSAIRNHKIPIIAMTAHVMQGDREKCLEAGMDDYISKPVAPQALAEALEKWLPKENAECGMMNDECRKKKEEIDEGGSPPSIITYHSSLIFDRQGLMARLTDDDNLIRTIIEAFLKDIPKQISALKEYIDQGESEQAGLQAHKIKGAAANVGGVALSAVAFEVEKAGQAGRLDEIAAFMPELEEQFELLKAQMREVEL